MRAVISRLNLTYRRHLHQPNHHAYLGTISTYPVQIIQYRQSRMLPSFLYPSPRRLTTPAGIEGQCRSSSPFRRGIQSSMLKVPKASPRSYTVKKPRSTPHSTPTQTPRPNPELTAWTEIRGRKTDNKPQTQAHK